MTNCNYEDAHKCFFPLLTKNEYGFEESEMLLGRNCNVYLNVINDQIRKMYFLLRHTLFWPQCFKCGHCPKMHLYIKCLVLNYSNEVCGP